MTEAEIRLSDEKMRAEIARLIAETSKINLESRDKMRAEMDKMFAETSKLNAENRYYPMVVASGATLAIVAIVKLFL